MVDEAEAAALRPAFDVIRRFMGLRNYGIDVPAFRRIEDAIRTARDFRRANTNGGQLVSYEPLCLSVRIAADQFAIEIEDHAHDAGSDLDLSTVRTIVAGLRCPARPYCKGCPSCQTITAPVRENTAARRSSL